MLEQEIYDVRHTGFALSLIFPLIKMMTIITVRP